MENEQTTLSSQPTNPEVATTTPSSSQLFKNETNVAIASIATWSKFLSIVSFICIGILLIAGAYLFFSGLMGDGYADQYLWLVGLVYVIMAIVMIFPTCYLFRSAKLFRKYADAGNIDDLENALVERKSFWKFQGILTIIYLALVVLMLIICCIVGAAALSTL